MFKLTVVNDTIIIVHLNVVTVEIEFQIISLLLYPLIVIYITASMFKSNKVIQRLGNIPCSRERLWEDIPIILIIVIRR